MYTLNPYDGGGGGGHDSAGVAGFMNANDLLEQNLRNREYHESGTYGMLTPTKSTQSANRNLAYLFSSQTFGDPLIANIYGTQARVSMSDPLDSVIPALNFAPYTYGNQPQNPVKDASVEGETQDPGVEVPGSNAPGFWDKLASIFSSAGLTNLPNVFPDTQEIKDTATRGAKYTLLAVVALILLVFGLYLLVKDSDTVKASVKAIAA